MEKYSTKNLYLCQLGQLLEIDNNSLLQINRCFEETERYILATKTKKHFKNVYIDIFTKTTYRPVEHVKKIGEYGIYGECPIITNLEYMTKDNLTDILESANSTCQESTADHQKCLKNNSK